MAIFIIAPWMAHAVTVPELGECVGGTCPSDAEYIDGFMFGCGTQSSCYCVNSDGEGWDIPCSCWEDSQCGTSGWGCIDGECQKCKTCSNCTGSNTWEAANTGYQRKARKQCACDGTCNVYYDYRCAAGYYGTSANGTYGCTQCPEATDIYTDSARTILARGTSAVGTTSQAECYLPAGTYYDASGVFTVTGTSCKY